MCEMDGCTRLVNRDGLCFPHKIRTLRFDIDTLQKENRGLDASGGLGTSEYVKRMYETRRAAGLNDPEPANKKAAVYAPVIGTRGGKKYRAQNGGL